MVHLIHHQSHDHEINVTTPAPIYFFNTTISRQPPLNNIAATNSIRPHQTSATSTNSSWLLVASKSIDFTSMSCAKKVVGCFINIIPLPYPFPLTLIQLTQHIAFVAANKMQHFESQARGAVQSRVSLLFSSAFSGLLLSKNPIKLQHCITMLLVVSQIAGTSKCNHLCSEKHAGTHPIEVDYFAFTSLLTCAFHVSPTTTQSDLNTTQISIHVQIVSNPPKGSLSQPFMHKHNTSTKMGNRNHYNQKSHKIVMSTPSLNYGYLSFVSRN